MKRAVHALIILALATGLSAQTALAGGAAEGVTIAVAPHTLLLSSIQGGEVTVHAEIAYGRVETASITLNGVAVKWTKSDARGELVAKFDEDEVKAIVTAPSADLTLRGMTVDGEPFEGTDTVRVVP